MALTIEIKVVPSSGRQRCMLDKSGMLKCYLKNPPERGLANEELIGLLAKSLHIPKQKVTIIMGATGRKKIVKIDKDIPFSELLQRLDVEVQQSLLEQPTKPRSGM